MVSHPETSIDPIPHFLILTLSDYVNQIREVRVSQQTVVIRDVTIVF